MNQVDSVFTCSNDRLELRDRKRLVSTGWGNAIFRSCGFIERAG